MFARMTLIAAAVVVLLSSTSGSIADEPLWTDAERTKRSDVVFIGKVVSIKKSGALNEHEDQFVASIEPVEGVVIAGGGGEYVARADDWMLLGRTMSTGERPPGSRLRIAVDPPR